ncbi:hypothetical protein HYALB_00011603 [Hymenoscyphus albidus]|uniref:Uncharacterized protein n=1 Tax=Hymenoscyphus albidus TaxID=595503 RepID=A0A9N9PY19_9HELO|nr:hypothetical protein HYALB_00011603 [Hymenoscyphus albidus]
MVGYDFHIINAIFSSPISHASSAALAYPAQATRLTSLQQFQLSQEQKQYIMPKLTKKALCIENRSGEEYDKRRRESLERAFGVVGVVGVDDERGGGRSKNFSLPESKPTSDRGVKERQTKYIHGHPNGLRAHPVERKFRAPSTQRPSSGTRDRDEEGKGGGDEGTEGREASYSERHQDGFRAKSADGDAVSWSMTKSRHEMGNDGSELEAILEWGFRELNTDIWHVETDIIPLPHPEPSDESKNEGMSSSAWEYGGSSAELKGLVQEPAQHQELASLPIAESDVSTQQQRQLPQRSPYHPRHQHSSTSSSDTETDTMKKVNWDESTFEEQRYRPTERRGSRFQRHGGHPTVADLMGWSYSGPRSVSSTSRIPSMLSLNGNSITETDIKHKHELRFSGPVTRNGKLVKRGSRGSLEVLDSVSGNGEQVRPVLSVMDGQFWREPRRTKSRSMQVETNRNSEAPLLNAYEGPEISGGRERNQSPPKHPKIPESAGGNFGDWFTNVESRIQQPSQFPVQAPVTTSPTRYNSLPVPVKGNVFEKFQNGSLPRHEERLPLTMGAEERVHTTMPRTGFGYQRQPTPSGLARPLNPPRPLPTPPPVSNVSEAKQESSPDSFKVLSTPPEDKKVSSLPPLNHIVPPPKSQVPNFSLPVPSRNEVQSKKPIDKPIEKPVETQIDKTPVLRTKLPVPTTPSAKKQELRIRSPTSSSTPQRTPSFNGSPSSVNSVYHTPASSLTSSRVDLTTFGGNVMNTQEDKKIQADEGQRDEMSESTKSSLPEAPIRTPPVPPTAEVTKAVPLDSRSEPTLTFLSSDPNTSRRSEAGENSNRATSLDATCSSEHSATTTMAKHAENKPPNPAFPAISPPKTPSQTPPPINEPKKPALKSLSRHPDAHYFSQLSNPKRVSRCKSSDVLSPPPALSERPFLSRTTFSSQFLYPLTSNPHLKVQTSSLPTTPKSQPQAQAQATPDQQNTLQTHPEPSRTTTSSTTSPQSARPSTAPSTAPSTTPPSILKLPKNRHPNNPLNTHPPNNPPNNPKRNTSLPNPNKLHTERNKEVKKEVKRFEESRGFSGGVSLTEVFREGVKKGHGLGFVEGYAAGVRAGRGGL